MFSIKKENELDTSNKDSKWLVESLWLNEGIGMLAAQPKTGKSWLAMDLAISICSGMPFLNKFPVVGGAKRVLVFFAEDTQSIQSERINLIKKAKKIDCIDNLGIIVGKEALRLDTTEGVLALRALVSEFKPSLIIIDPFVRVHQISESDSTAVAKILQELRNIKNDFGTGVLLVHHASKGTKALRGSTEFAAWGETNLFMFKDKQEQVHIDIQHRAAESIDAIPLRIGELNGGVSIFVNDSLPILEENENSPQVFENITDKILSALSRHSNPKTIAEIQEKVGMPIAEVKNEIYKLVRSKEIQWTKTGYKAA